MAIRERLVRSAVPLGGGRSPLAFGARLRLRSLQVGLAVEAVYWHRHFMNQEPKVKTTKCASGKPMAVGLSMGVGLGAGVGAALHNLAMGIAIGIAIGAAIGAVITFKCGNKD